MLSKNTSSDPRSLGPGPGAHRVHLALECVASQIRSGFGGFSKDITSVWAIGMSHRMIPHDALTDLFASVGLPRMKPAHDGLLLEFSLAFNVWCVLL